MAARGRYRRWSRSAPAQLPCQSLPPCPRCLHRYPACTCLCPAPCQKPAAPPLTMGISSSRPAPRAQTCFACTRLALCGVLHPFWWPCPRASTQSVSLDAIPPPDMMSGNRWLTGGLSSGMQALPRAHRCCTAASISVADLPEAQMMKMCPNLVSYRAFHSASACQAEDMIVLLVHAWVSICLLS